MKKIFTLAAAGMLAAGTLSAQAQVSVDGELTAAELTTGNYMLLGKFTNARGFGDAGLISMYAASTPTKLYIFVGGTVEPNTNGFELFMDVPGIAGIPVGTALPAGTTGTYFEQMISKLDQETDLALSLRAAVRGNANAFEIQGAAYNSTPTPSAVSSVLTTTAGQLASDGTALTLDATKTMGAYAPFANARMAYVTSPGNIVSANPGAVPANTDPAYGAEGTLGWEIEIDRAAAGLNGAPNISLFVVMNGDTGGYLSSDFIPQTSAPVAGNNLGSGSFDFTALPDTQSALFTLVNAVLATKAADAAALGINVFPNPSAGRATINYNVEKAAPVNVVLTDLMGRQVRVLESATKNAGKQSVSLSTADVAAGTYLVRVQVGDKVATRKVVLL